MNRRLLAAAFMLSLALAAALALQDDPPEVALVPARSPAVRPAPSAASMPAPATAATLPMAEAAHGRATLPEPPPAALAAWRGPATAASAVASAASEPRAAPPAFPYRWIGRLDDTLLLAGKERSFGARAGEVIDQRWRVDRVAGARLQLTWLPSGEPVFVEFR